MCFGGSSSPSTSTTVVSNNSAPWGPQGTQLEHILSEGRRLYDEGARTPIPFSPQSEQALRMTEDRALAGNPAMQAAQGQLLGTIDGSFLSAGNPHFQAMADRAVQPLVRNFTNAVAPGIDSAFSRAGRLGSGAYANARNTAEETLAEEMGSLTGALAYRNYQDERTAQQRAQAMAPQFAAQDYQDAQQLAGVGAARENLAERQAMSDYEHLARFLGISGGNYGSASTSTQTAPVYSNPAASFLGGAIGGGGLGYQIGGPWGAGIGAIGGGLLGLF